MFTLVEYQPRMHVILYRYVFRVKKNALKVRIVAKGFRRDICSCRNACESSGILVYRRNTRLQVRPNGRDQSILQR
eukprot:IDg10082t1